MNLKAPYDYINKREALEYHSSRLNGGLGKCYNLIMKRSFKIKIIKLFLISSLLPLLVISVSSLYITIRTRQQNIVELENLAIENASEKIEKYLNQKVETFNLVINTDPESISDIDMATLDFLIENIRNTAGHIEAISFISRDGQEILKKARTESPVYSLADYSDADFFREAITLRKHFGEVREMNGRKVIQLASQIENKDRRPIGAIMAWVDLGAVEDIVRETRIGKEGFLILAGKGGRIIFSPLASLPYGTVGEMSGVTEMPGNDGYYRTSKLSLGGSEPAEVSFIGKDIGIADLSLMSIWPEKDAFRAVNSIIYIAYLIILATIILVFILSFSFARTLLKPINSLGQAAKQIEENNLDFRLELKTGDEFEILGDKFNRMVEVLKENKKLKDEFVFIAAHELRTPVTAIKGYLSMVIDGSMGPVSEKVKQALSTVFYSNERLVQLVQDLLEVARGESGKMVLSIKDIDISEGVDLVRKELAPLAAKKGIAINYAEEKIMVKADDYKLKEVLTNIIGNAIKYTLSDGAIEIFHERKGDLLVTHIKDHGMGMKPEDVSKLFSKFYRIKNEQTEKIEGTGLGLFIVKEIIERMGGTIEVDSEYGRGSDFKFSLKIA